MIKTFIQLVLAFALLACNSSDPVESAFVRDRPLQRSDSLVNVILDLAERLKATPLTGDRDVDVVTELIEHHTAAIEMGRILQRDGSDPDLKAFAKELDLIFTDEIGKLRDFLEHHPPVSGAGKRGVSEWMDILNTTEPTDDLDAAYRTLMAKHLEHGIALARKEQERGLHGDMKETAGEMVRNSEAMLAELTGRTRGRSL